jgi:hypothetical protein
MTEQRRSECRQPALRGRVGAEQSIGRRHEIRSSSWLAAM